MRNNDGKVIGYVVAIPQRHIYEDFKKHDPAMVDDPERFYMEANSFVKISSAQFVLRVLSC